MGKKRAQLSFSLRSDTTSSHEHIHRNDTGKTKIIEEPNPSTANTSVSLTTGPFDYRSERTVDGKTTVVEKKGSEPAIKQTETEYDTSEL